MSSSNLCQKRRIGLYEKALPDIQNWEDFAARMRTAKELGFHYWEISIDESDNRLTRLNWSKQQCRSLLQNSWEHDFPIHSMCLSGHRRYPLGSKDAGVRKHAIGIMEQGIELAYNLGIRLIQIAGYDVYYEEHDDKTHEMFLDGLEKSCCMAAKAGVILAVEIMDTPYLNSISKYLNISTQIQSPFLKVYPDLGNLFAWNNDFDLLRQDLAAGISEIVALHIKDTKRVTGDFNGQFRDLLIGEGEVDFIKYFTILSDLSYSGPFVIEMWAKDFDEKQCQDRLQLALSRVHQAMDTAQFAV